MHLTKTILVLNCFASFSVEAACASEIAEQRIKELLARNARRQIKNAPSTLYSYSSSTDSLSDSMKEVDSLEQRITDILRRKDYSYASFEFLEDQSDENLLAITQNEEAALEARLFCALIFKNLNVRVKNLDTLIEKGLKSRDVTLIRVSKILQSVL